MKLSAVILNFNRPDYLKETILPHLEPLVDEILVSHGKKETAFDKSYTRPFYHFGKYDKEYGLTLRFLTALEAKNDYVLIMDDDIIPESSTINFLYNAIKSDKERIHGIYGRNVLDGYKIENAFGEVPVVLTRCMVTTKEMCKYFIDNFRKYESELVKNSKPYWNGEDILFSLLSIKKYNKLPKAYNLPHQNRLANYLDFSQSISLGSGHKKYREEITKEFLKKLKLKDTISNKINISSKKNDIVYFIENSILFYIIILIIFISLFFYFRLK